MPTFYFEIQFLKIYSWLTAMIDYSTILVILVIECTFLYFTFSFLSTLAFGVFDALDDLAFVVFEFLLLV